MRKIIYPVLFASFCSLASGCALTGPTTKTDTDPLPLIPDNAKIDVLKYPNLPDHQLKGIARFNTVLSLFYQAGAAASKGECADAMALVRTAQGTSFWFDEGNAQLAPIVWRKLFIAAMVGQNAVSRCSP